MKKIVCLLLMTIGLFGSCIPNPEENVDPAQAPENVLVRKIVVTDVDGDSTSEFLYEGKKILSQNDSDGLRTIYTYEGDLITAEETFDETELIEKVSYVYDVSNNLLSATLVNFVEHSGERQEYIHNAGGTITYHTFYGDENAQDDEGDGGTITPTTYVENVSSPVNVDTHTFTYDTKNNPFKNVVGMDKIWFAFSDEPTNYKNNILSCVHSNDLGLSEVSYTMTYSYNASNFPTGSSSTNGAGVLTETTHYTY